MFLPLPNMQEQRSVRVWCPAFQSMVETKGTVTPRLGLEVLLVDACVLQVLGCPCLKDREKRKLCLIDREVASGSW